MKIKNLVIQFPDEIEVLEGMDELILDVVRFLCFEYEKSHPESSMRIIWHDFKYTVSMSPSFMFEEDHLNQIKLEDNTYIIYVDKSKKFPGVASGNWGKIGFWPKGVLHT